MWSPRRMKKETRAWRLAHLTKRYPDNIQNKGQTFWTRIQFLAARARLFLISLCSNDCFGRNRRRIGRHDMPHNERCRKPDSIGDIRRKKTPACSVVEQAGVPIDRVFGGLRERKGDRKIRKFWTANANPEDRPNLVDPIWVLGLWRCTFCHFVLW